MENIENTYSVFDPLTDDDYDDSPPEQDFISITGPVAIGFAALDTILSRSDLMQVSGSSGIESAMEGLTETRVALLSECNGFESLEYLLPVQQQRKNDLEIQIENIDTYIAKLLQKADTIKSLQGMKAELISKRSEINIFSRRERAEINWQIHEIDAKIIKEHLPNPQANEENKTGKVEKRHNLGKKVLYFVKAAEITAIRSSAAGAGLHAYQSNQISAPNGIDEPEE